MRLARLAAEPLLQFLVAGAAIYALWSALGPEDAAQSGRRIVVEREALLGFMQFRARAFEPEVFAARLDALSPAEREELIADYVREEALYREARALGLEQGDDVLRQRLVEKMAFLLEGELPSGEPDEQELAAYFDRHADAYVQAPAYTFTHVFFDRAARGEQGAQRAAARLLAAMNRERVAANESEPYGDRYPFLQHYEQRPAEYVSGHFGAAFSAALARLPVEPARWQGPLRSDQGWHVVMLRAQRPARTPVMEEVRDQVVADLQRERQAAQRESAISALLARYEVAVAPDLAVP